jgi:phosphatidylserine/phosphatidylglycerophosphate/cardiolipin synthase-like enzyme
MRNRTGVGLLGLVGLTASIAACSSGSASPSSAARNDAGGAGDTGVVDPGEGGAGDATAQDAAPQDASLDAGPLCVGDACAPPAITQYFSTPEPTLTQIIDLIGGAKKSIHMIMYWITLPDLAGALAAAAQRGVDVQVIIDNGNWTGSTPDPIKTTLLDGGVKVTPSSTGFSISHCKSMVIDGTTTMIGSINLIYTYDTTRDFAVVTEDPSIAAEFEAVFHQDLANAASSGTATPTLTNPYLLWSPVNSQAGILALIDSATKTIELDTENLSTSAKTGVLAALEAAAARGVTVRVLSPECDLGTSNFNFAATTTLDGLGVDARLMPYASPTVYESVAVPYIHAKMVIADQARAFVGSENLSVNSLQDAREVGIVFTDEKAIAAFEADFNQDFALGVLPPDAAAACPPEPSLTGP